jgi:hypothetical protein
MATKGQAARSATGAAMSKYDVEVEARLKALEAKAAEPAPAAGGDTSELEAKLDRVIGLLKSKFPAVFKDL